MITGRTAKMARGRSPLVRVGEPTRSVPEFHRPMRSWAAKFWKRQQLRWSWSSSPVVGPILAETHFQEPSPFFVFRGMKGKPCQSRVDWKEWAQRPRLIHTYKYWASESQDRTGSYNFCISLHLRLKLPRLQDSTSRILDSCNSSSQATRSDFSSVPSLMAQTGEFQATITAPAGCSKTLHLAGHGVEEKNIKGNQVKVAQLNVYIEKDVTSHLQAWEGKSAQDLAQDNAFFTTLIKAPVEKFVKVGLLVGPIPGPHYGSQVEASIKERLLKEGKLGEAEEKALQELLQFFKPITQLGSSVLYAFPSPSLLILTVQADGAEESHAISNDAIVFALLDTIFGGNTLSPSTTVSTVQGIAAWLN